MGCPFKVIEKQGAGAALIKKPLLAQKIIKATIDGAGLMPVSVKTRIGYRKDESKTWIPKILEMNPAALTVHGRTQKEKSKVPTHWDILGKISSIIKSNEREVIFIGNGDVESIEDGEAKAKQYGIDGIMVGRAAMNNPWFFSGKNMKQITLNDKLGLLVKHAYLYEKNFRGIKNFQNMRKFYSSYVSEFEDSKKLRIELMKAQSAEEIEITITSFLKK